LRGADARSHTERLIVIGFSLSLLILAFVGLFSYRATRRLIQTDIRSNESHEVFDQVDALLMEVLEVESSARGYVLGGKDFYLEPYYASLSRIDQTMRNLKTMTENNPRLQSKALAMKGPIQDKLAYHQRQIKMRSRLGLKATIDSFATGTDHKLMDNIREIADAVKREEKDLMGRQEAEVRSAAHQSIYLLASGSVLALAILISIYWNLMKEISRRKSTEAALIHLNGLHLVMGRINQAISPACDRDEILRKAACIAASEDALEFTWFGLFDESTGLLKPLQNRSAAERFCSIIPISIGHAPDQNARIEKELIQGKHFICNDARADPAFKSIADVFLSFAVFPLRTGGTLVGALCVLSKEVGYFNVETAVLLDQLASNLSNALEAIEAEGKRQQAVEQISKLNEQLEQRVKQRTEELAVANSELALRNQEVERANRLKSEFLANMSHELRTPLNAIIGFSDLLAEEKAGPLQTKQKRFVGHISAGAHHLLKLINEVLDISRIEAGRTDLEPEIFGAAMALSEVLSVISPLAQNKKIEVDSRVADDVRVFADRVRFKQILYNLLSNALKFTPELGKAWVDAVSEPDGVVRFAVGDTGIGIPMKEQKAIFDEFHQVIDISRDVKEGAGLGLAITRRLVELSGGRIWVESEPGKGSTFCFTLPSLSPLKSARLSQDPLRNSIT
jgi:signal transduction histidine kinase